MGGGQTLLVEHTRGISYSGQFSPHPFAYAKHSLPYGCLLSIRFSKIYPTIVVLETTLETEWVGHEVVAGGVGRRGAQNRTRVHHYTRRHTRTHTAPLGLSLFNSHYTAPRQRHAYMKSVFSHPTQTRAHTHRPTPLVPLRFGHPTVIRVPKKRKILYAFSHTHTRTPWSIRRSTRISSSIPT